ncbi:hypothetical protein [Calothrix sp. 336/3]|uniref:hypothetical protein n=1 Tax=Calothrix sp. 336/3 TaxID=1337936 RepID=UPI0004E3E6D9|nr:hypothetical protein [Calothrix sp. 336/3]AKG22949.1 hypothetical protein IJ00_18185 [Calothrix sp. 336/3]
MANQVNGMQVNDIDIEFLEALLQPEDAAYPWNTSDPVNEEYFLQVEADSCLQDVLEEEATERSLLFFNQLDNLWSSYYNDTTEVSLVNQVQENLQTMLAAAVPQEWLQAIAHKAVNIFKSQQSFSEQLVECVQSVLPMWESDDLSVFARPLAYAMRSSDSQSNVESLLNNVKETEWTKLSEIEQARVSMAIAYYTLRQLNNSATEK